MALILLLARNQAIHRAVGPQLADLGHVVIPVIHGPDARIGVSVVPIDLMISTAHLLDEASPSLWAGGQRPRGRTLPLLSLGLPSTSLVLPPWVLLIVLPGPWSRHLVLATVHHYLWCATQD